jgi:hypothetical protein
MSMSVSRRSSATGHPTRQQLDELDALLKRMLDLPVNRLEDEADAAPPAPAAEAAPPPPPSAPEPMRGPHRPTVARMPAEPPAVNYSTAEEEDADLKPRVVSDAPHHANEPAAPPAPASQKPNADKPDDWVPLTSTWRPSARTWKPLSEAWKQAQTASGQPSVPPAVEEEPALAVEAAAPPASTAPEAPVEAAPPTPEPALEAAPVEAAAPDAGRSRDPVRPGGRRWLLWPLLGFNAVFDACLTPWGAPGRWLRGRIGRMVLGALGLLALAAAAVLAAADWFGWTG